jgi:hypothetical protein
MCGTLPTWTTTIIKRAQDERASWELIANRYIDEFNQDATALGLLAPAIEPRADRAYSRDDRKSSRDLSRTDMPIESMETFIIRF